MVVVVFSVVGMLCVSAVFVVALDSRLSPGKRRKEEKNVDYAAD